MFNSKTKAITALLLAAAMLLLAACGGGAPESISSGGQELLPTGGAYAEQNITPTGAQLSLVTVQADGGILAMDTGYTTRWRSAGVQGADWEKASGWLANAQGIQEVEKAIFLSEDVLLAWCVFEDDSRAPVRLTQSGSWELYPLQGLEDAEGQSTRPWVSLLQSAGEGRLLVGYGWYNEQANSFTNRTVLVDESSGRLLAEYPLGDMVSAAVIGETAYFAEATGEVYAYSLENHTGESIGTLPLGYNMFIHLAVYKDVLFGASVSGIAYLDDTGEAHMQVDANRYSFGGSSNNVRSFAVLPDGSFLVNTMGGSLYRYIWGEQEQADENVLKVFSFFENEKLTNTVRAFSRTHPDITVELEIGWTMETTLSTDDILTNLSAAILSGTGPDVLVLDNLPRDSYMRQGILADLTGLIDHSDMYENIAAPFLEGGLYYLPTGIQIPLLVTTGPDEPTLDEVLQQLLTQPFDLETAKEAMRSYTELPTESKAPLLYSGYKDLTMELFDIFALRIATGTDINYLELEAYYQLILDVATRLDITNEQNFMSASQGYWSETVRFRRYYSDSFMRVLTGQANNGIQMLDGIAALLTMQTAAQQGYAELDYRVHTLPAGQEGLFKPVGLMAVSEASGKKEAAAAFIQEALSIEVQSAFDSQFLNAGMPVTKSGAHAQFTVLEEIHIDIYELDEEYLVNTYEELAQSVTTPILYDTQVYNAVVSVSWEMPQEGLTAKQAVSQVEEYMRLYIAERQ